jgi:oligopeptide/dipeptide ABC transporter ATP-binding protein
MSLLEVEDLHVSFPTPDGLVRAVRGVSFAVESGETLAIVGESGSGKSVSTQTIVGLTRGAKIEGEARFNGQNLLSMNDRELRGLRGSQIGMIFQDPLTSLHPFYKVGWQIVEAIRTHEDVSKRQARERAIEMLDLVGIPQPNRRVDDYPHQFSGGMRQRAMIAMSLALNPTLLIADEPTTALDVTVQAQVMELLKRLQKEFGTAIVLITHDLGVVADSADDVLVMYAGKMMETASRREIYYRPHHPYTKGLLESLPQSSAAPSESSSDGAERLPSIPGQPPSLITPPSGCPFHPRCGFVMDKCVGEPPPLSEADRDSTHRSACWLPSDQVGMGADTDEARMRVVGQQRGATAERIVASREGSNA